MAAEATNSQSHYNENENSPYYREKQFLVGWQWREETISSAPLGCHPETQENKQFPSQLLI